MYFKAMVHEYNFIKEIVVAEERNWESENRDRNIIEKFLGLLYNFVGITILEKWHCSNTCLLTVLSLLAFIA